MSTTTKLTDLSSSEQQAATGGISFGTAQLLAQFSDLTPMQVSALKYYNRLDDPAKYQDVIPTGPGLAVPGSRFPRG